ncbi:unnamed protein product, partial [Schistosoma rodhaini]
LSSEEWQYVTQERWVKQERLLHSSYKFTGLKDILTFYLEKITEELVSVAEDQLGSALTFNLIEYLKENHERFAKSFAVDKVDKSQSHSFSSETSSVSRKQDKLPQLSKSQKRKHLDRLGQDGELPRGWNWVSVIKHLQQTGSAS